METNRSSLTQTDHHGNFEIAMPTILHFSGNLFLVSYVHFETCLCFKDCVKAGMGKSLL